MFSSSVNPTSGCHCGLPPRSRSITSPNVPQKTLASSSKSVYFSLESISSGGGRGGVSALIRKISRNASVPESRVPRIIVGGRGNSPHLPTPGPARRGHSRAAVSLPVALEQYNHRQKSVTMVIHACKTSSDRCTSSSRIFLGAPPSLVVCGAPMPTIKKSVGALAADVPWRHR